MRETTYLVLTFIMTISSHGICKETETTNSENIALTTSPQDDKVEGYFETYIGWTSARAGSIGNAYGGTWGFAGGAMYKKFGIGVDASLFSGAKLVGSSTDANGNTVTSEGRLTPIRITGDARYDIELKKFVIRPHVQFGVEVNFTNWQGATTTSVDPVIIPALAATYSFMDYFSLGLESHLAVIFDTTVTTNFTLALLSHFSF